MVGPFKTSYSYEKKGYRPVCQKARAFWQREEYKCEEKRPKGPKKRFVTL
jgi:hypothetical protein